MAYSKIGIDGEELAGGYLMGKGYRILHRNWNLHKGFELDLVAQKDDTVVFVEVKTRSGNSLGNPENAVNKKKRDHIIRAANYYVKFYNIDAIIRFDIIAIVYRNDKDYNLRHIENAFNVPLSNVGRRW